MNYQQCFQYECKWEDDPQYLSGVNNIARAMFRIHRNEHVSSDDLVVRTWENGT